MVGMDGAFGFGGQEERSMFALITPVRTVLLATLVFTLGFAVAASAQTTWYVDDDAPPGGDGSPEHPFQHIQDGINAASDGDTVFVFNGTYYEHVSVDESITLVGETQTDTIIDGSLVGTVLFLVVPDISISYFTIQHSGTDSDQPCAAILTDCTGSLTISHTRIVNNQYGVLSPDGSSSNHNSIAHNIIMSNQTGIGLDFSDHNNISSNIISSNGTGIFIRGSSAHNDIRGNVITDNVGRGIRFYYWYNFDAHNNIVDNVISGNDRGVSIGYEFRYNSLVDNTITNNYQEGISLGSEGNQVVGNYISGNGTGLYMPYHRARNAIVENTIINNGQHGVVLKGDNNTFSGNTVLQHDVGVHLRGSEGSVLAENTIEARVHGMFLEDVHSATVAGNTLSGDLLGGGVMLVYCEQNLLSDNVIAGGALGLAVTTWSHNNTVSGNILTENDYGTYLALGCAGNTIRGNRIEGSGRYGVYLVAGSEGSHGNTFYHNSFISNAGHAYDDCANSWDSGYPGGGNYWDDYEGADEYSGSEQNEPGADGIGDTPYPVAGGENQDGYPLMNIWIAGDLDYDGDVDQEDLALLLAAWDSQPGDDHWNVRADLDEDQHVGQGDLGVLLANWGYGT